MERNSQLFLDNHPLISASQIYHQNGARRALHSINADEQVIDSGVNALIKQGQYLATGFGLFCSLFEAEPDAAHEVPTSYRLRPIGMPRTPYKSLNSTVLTTAPSPLADVSFKPISASKPLQPSTPVKSSTSLGCSGCQVALFAVIPESDASTSSSSSHMEFSSPLKSHDTTPSASPPQTSRKAPKVSDIRLHSSSSIGSDTESSTIPLPLGALPASPLPCPRTPVPSSNIQTPAARQLQINEFFSAIKTTPSTERCSSGSESEASSSNKSEPVRAKGVKGRRALHLPTPSSKLARARRLEQHRPQSEPEPNEVRVERSAPPHKLRRTLCGARSDRLLSPTSSSSCGELSHSPSAPATDSIAAGRPRAVRHK